MNAAKSQQSVAGVVLPTVLVLSLAVALMVGAALRESALEARGAAWRWEAIRARNFAETALELLLRRTEERWHAGSEHCPVDQYCASDFPSLSAFLEEAPAHWVVSVSLAPPSVRPRPREEISGASSARVYRRQRIEARVRIDGPAPVALAAGLVLPAVAMERTAP
ncbi:MAG: hypothetical protein ACX93N_06955 [Pseudohaliea sp.]